MGILNQSIFSLTERKVGSLSLHKLLGRTGRACLVYGAILESQKTIRFCPFQYVGQQNLKSSYKHLLSPHPCSRLLLYKRTSVFSSQMLLNDSNVLYGSDHEKSTTLFTETNSFLVSRPMADASKRFFCSQRKLSDSCNFSAQMMPAFITVFIIISFGPYE